MRELPGVVLAIGADDLAKHVKYMSPFPFQSRDPFRAGNPTIETSRLLSVSAEQHLEPVARLPGTPRLDMLTDREREILRVVANGLSNPAIADRLDLSEHTVKRHVANILLKLDLPTRAAAAALVGRQRAL